MFQENISQNLEKSIYPVAWGLAASFITVNGMAFAGAEPATIDFAFKAAFYGTAGVLYAKELAAPLFTPPSP